MALALMAPAAVAAPDTMLHVDPANRGVVDAVLQLNNTNSTPTNSACSQYSESSGGTCSLCTSQESLLGDCFWCSEDNSCHDFGSLDFPSSCWNMGCVSHSSVTSCTGLCGAEAIPSGFDVQLAQCMLAMANATYYTSETLTEAMSAIGVSSFEVLSNTTSDTQGVVVAHPKANAITIAYRGTVLSVQDGLLDIDCTLQNYQTLITPLKNSTTSGWRVANGFGTAYNSLESQLHAELTWALGQVGKKPTLYITGHSLGAAMASIAASVVLLNSTLTSLLSTVKVYTFAAPRSGNPTYADAVSSLADTWWGVQNFFDQIPHLPPASWGRPAPCTCCSLPGTL